MTDPGYGFVPLPPSVRRVARAEASWNRRIPGTFAGCIGIELVAEQPVHVGSGSKHTQQRDVVMSGARVRGGPGIPGSSLKGVLRARYEAITHSCAIAVPRAGRDLKIRSSTGIKKARLLLSALGPAVQESSCTRDRLCAACALFGRMSLRSRISVTDLTCVGGIQHAIAQIPERFGPNLHHVGTARLDPTGNVFEVRDLDGRKFGLGRGPAAESRQRVEVIPAGTTITGQLRLFNVTAAELGGLLAALGREPSSALKLGGGKAHGLGRVRCTAVSNIAGFDPLDSSAWRRQFLDSADRWSVGEDRLVALHRGDC